MIASPLSRRASSRHSALLHRTILLHPASLIFLLAVLFSVPLQAQSLPVSLFRQQGNTTIFVTAGGQPFATFIYPDTLAKPVLYPIYAPDGQLITRGFPLNPRPGEPVDHPHHVGLWLNYENVNGLDFWNTSYPIPAAKRSQYGWIHTEEAQVKGSALEYTARWTDQQGHPLLLERTGYRFRASDSERIIDRITTLTALTDTGVSFPDAKD